MEFLETAYSPCSCNEQLGKIPFLIKKKINSTVIMKAKEKSIKWVIFVIVT